ncbi:MTOR-associated protein MEAK7 [Suncus etruscus]|uniref:MTOR-associated protein MEAK7 n=1 Tax=Suncus etruscus TaxID=109475 RepID=UPI00210F7DF3|nr:MTOR-associated protein MEAK7 [Suncus etruscus]
MGNNRSRTVPTFCPQLLPEEQAEISRLFNILSPQRSDSGSDAAPRYFLLKALQGHVGEALPPEMVMLLYTGMRRSEPVGSGDGISREQLLNFLAHLLKGVAEERGLLLLRMISDTPGPISAAEVQKFAELLVDSVAQVLTHRQELRGWTRPKALDSTPRFRELVTQLLSELKLQDGRKLQGPQQLDGLCDQAALEDWVFRAPLVGTFLSLLVYGALLRRRWTPGPAPLVPKRQVEPGQDFASLLDVMSVIFINSHLPPQWRHRWHLLFASDLHGCSFAHLCRRITHRGPCLLLLQDHDGHVFGGFSSCSWEVKPQFQGDASCFLFSVSPHMAVYPCTGSNNHYMYLNRGQQTIPNGLGMGGQHHYFGLWIDEDFGKGHSKAKPTCTTYNSPQLSGHEDFCFDRMEVWAVGNNLSVLSTNSSKSILDVDPEAQALLQISGRSFHSQEVWEPPENA